MRIVLAIVCALAGCIGSDSVKCGDVTCPAGTVCGAFEDKPICLTREQSTTCDAQPDGARCTADDSAGICQQQLCLPGCGDGELDVGEECDDGNFTSHDACSSSCLTEYAGWRQWQSPWRGRSGHVAGYHAATQQLVMLGGFTNLGNFLDQWTRSANGEWKRSLPPVSGRRYAAMAYDSVRERLVLFGGFDSGRLDDTWEYDGATWIKRDPPTKPPARYGAGMVFDPVRARMIVFGGCCTATNYHADTWEYDGTTWTQVTTASAPPGRQWPAMAWDPARSRAVLFGGFTNGERFDTWEYANQVWTQIATPVRPQARHAPAFAYSASRGKLVLFAGALTLQENASDTWEYDGTWTPMTPPLSPEARAHATFTYDAVAQELILIQGVDNGQVALADVWRYDAQGRWADVSPAFSPSARIAPMVYDESRHQLVLVNGCSEGNFSVGGTWRFGRDADGEINWALVKDPAPLPPTFQRCFHALAYDSTRGRTLMYGGATNGANANLDDTWAWDGAAWMSLHGLNVPTNPPDRVDAAFAHDPRDQTSVLFGGTMMGAQLPTNETWELGATTWTRRDTPAALVAEANITMAYDAAAERIVLFSETGDTWTYRDHVWTKLVLADSPPKRRLARVVWDPWRRRVLLFGGTGTLTGIDYEDLWELHETTWKKIRLLGAQPPTRLRPAFAAFPELRSLVMFGGPTFDDTWLLTFASDTPNEVCGNGTDDDGDLQTDAADPDCTLYVFD